jgi:hypothetical protein
MPKFSSSILNFMSMGACVLTPCVKNSRRRCKASHIPVLEYAGFLCCPLWVE